MAILDICLKKQKRYAQHHLLDIDKNIFFGGEGDKLLRTAKIFYLVQPTRNSKNVLLNITHLKKCSSSCSRLGTEQQKCSNVIGSTYLKQQKCSTLYNLLCIALFYSAQFLILGKGALLKLSHYLFKPNNQPHPQIVQVT